MGLITSDHIKIVISSISLTIEIDEVLSDALGWKMVTGCTKWATIGKKLSGLIIVSVVYNEYIIVESISEPLPGIHTLVAPFYYYGTFLEANSELVKTPDSIDKLPFIYLHMNSPESYADEDATVDFTADCAIYFMVDCFPSGWLRGDHIENAIKPMKYLAKAFISALQEYSQTNSENTLTWVENDYANFGNVIVRGNESKIFADNLSGTEMLIDIPFNKDFLCSC
jgi:hypothetical protein